jgi:ABC-type branched-subunit amino acid transport system substrate-binding protein
MRRYRVLVAVVILSTIATGCRTGDDAAPDESDESTDQAAADAGDGDGGGGGGGETFGDLASPCGGGDAAGATDQGVTDDAILVGTMADATATVQPGLNQELWDSAEAFVGWCNEQGGIAGRPIELTQYESKLFEVKQATIEACDREFMLVGGGAGIDGDGVEERVGCGLPDMPAFNATVAATEADLNRPPVPLPFSELSAGEAFYLAEEFPDAVAKAGQLTPNFPSAINLAIRGELAYEAAGWNFVETQLYNPAGEANWTGLVAEFRSAGVEALVYTGTRDALAAFLQAASEQDWKPEVIIGTSSVFTDDLIVEAGEAAEGVYSYAAIEPFEEADDNPALATYIELLDEYADGAEPAHLGVNAMSAWLLWATAAEACGSDLTRDCVIDQIDEIGEWTGGGLHAPTVPGEGTGPSCFVLVQVQDGSWTRAHPTDGDYDCDPSYTVPTPGDYQ